MFQNQELVLPFSTRELRTENTPAAGSAPDVKLYIHGVVRHSVISLQESKSWDKNQQIKSHGVIALPLGLYMARFQKGSTEETPFSLKKSGKAET